MLCAWHSTAHRTARGVVGPFATGGRVLLADLVTGLGAFGVVACATEALVASAVALPSCRTIAEPAAAYPAA